MDVEKRVQELEAELKRTRSLPKWATEEEQAARKTKATNARLKTQIDSTQAELELTRNLAKTQAEEIEQMRGQLLLEKTTEMERKRWSEERERLWGEVALLQQDRFVDREPDHQMQSQVIALKAEAEGLRRCLQMRAEQNWTLSEKVRELNTEMSQLQDREYEVLHHEQEWENRKTRIGLEMRTLCTPSSPLVRATENVPSESHVSQHQQQQQQKQ